MANKWLHGNGRKCSHCHGSGVIYRPLNERRCEECSGSGRVALSDQDIALRQAQGLNT